MISNCARSGDPVCILFSQRHAHLLYRLHSVPDWIAFHFTIFIQLSSQCTSPFSFNALNTFTFLEYFTLWVLSITLNHIYLSLSLSLSQFSCASTSYSSRILFLSKSSFINFQIVWVLRNASRSILYTATAFVFANRGSKKLAPNFIFIFSSLNHNNYHFDSCK